mgnify:CR=1 FL=1
MAKKIVILNGSPRPSGNTAALIEAFTKGAEQAGNGVVRFDVCKMNIHPCLGCCGGGKNPESPCVQKDDMAAILDKFPKLRVCAAHLGGFRQRKYALDVLADRNVWMDTSSCM